MLWVAWKMLIGNRVKYLGIVFGVMFAALLIAQQSSIFCGLMSLTVSQIRDVEGPGIWVMDKNVQFVDDIKPLADTCLFRVKGVSGVEWAVRFYKGLARARMEEGDYHQMILLGMDDATLVGAPEGVFMGSIADLRKPDAVIMDDAGYQLIWPGEPFRLGRVFEMNDRRAVLVGLTKALRTFQSFPIIYTRYSQAVLFAPPERKVLSFVLAQPQPGLDPQEVCRRIEAWLGLCPHEGQHLPLRRCKEHRLAVSRVDDGKALERAEGLGEPNEHRATVVHFEHASETVRLPWPDQLIAGVVHDHGVGLAQVGNRPHEDTFRCADQRGVVHP